MHWRASRPSPETHATGRRSAGRRAAHIEKKALPGTGTTIQRKSFDFGKDAATVRDDVHTTQGCLLNPNKMSIEGAGAG